jgi:hypothetical protein
VASLDKICLKLTLVGFRVAVPLTDTEKRVIAMLAGHPDDSSWDAVSAEATRAIDEARDVCGFTAADRRHRRGKFPARAVGASFGGGQTVPGNLVNNAIDTAVLNLLISNWAIQRLAGFASGVFATWAPKLFSYYRSYLYRLHEAYPTIHPNFTNSIWTAATFNFGPYTTCFKHRDPFNLAFGWCAITALGNFNPKLGGHLILWEMKLVIEFPPGSTILIPSATIQHSNVALQPGDTRMSFTQYTAGGLFRWVDNGFQTCEDFKAEDEEGKRVSDEKAKERWGMGLGLFSTLDELTK